MKSELAYSRVFDPNNLVVLVGELNSNKRALIYSNDESKLAFSGISATRMRNFTTYTGSARVFDYNKKSREKNMRRKPSEII